MILEKKRFENIVGKGENAGYQDFLLFPQCFLPYERKNLIISAIFNFAVYKMLSILLCPKSSCLAELTLPKQALAFMCLQ